MKQEIEHKLLRITTVPISLKYLLPGQMKFMTKHGFHVIMVSADGMEIEAIIRSEGCEHVVIPFTRKISPVADFICLIHLIKLIKEIKPDIVHTHTPKAGLLGMLASKFSGVSIKIHTVAGLPMMTAKGWKKKLLIITERMTYWVSDFILPNSHSVLKYIETNLYSNRTKLSIIGHGSTNGVDLERFNKSGLDPDILEDIKLKIGDHAENIYLLAVGRVVRDKGIIELINAYVALSQEHKNLKLILLGPIENERSEERIPDGILETLSENKGIVHISWSDHVAYYMHLSDLLIHASHREGFPNVLLQAGAMEIPVVCSNIPGNIDIVSDQKTGLLFKVGDSKDIMEKIDFALLHRNEVEKFASQLNCEIKNKFSRDFVHQELLSFYRHKLSEH